MADATMRLLQQRMFEAALAADGEDEADLGGLAKALRGLADAARAGRAIRADRRVAAKELADAAASAAPEGARREGATLSEGTLRTIRRDVYGLLDDG